MRFHSIYAVSDIHTDYRKNLEWAKSLGQAGHGSDALLIAGDVADDVDTFAETMDSLSRAFGAVFFVPGNHDLWIRRDGSHGADSIAKLEKLAGICCECGVLTTPQRLAMDAGGAVSVLPLLSWYHSSFDVEPDVSQLRLPSARAVVADYKATRWPAPLENGGEALARHLDSLCDELPGERAAAEAAARSSLISQRGGGKLLATTPLGSYAEARAGGARVLSFSHFLPRIELAPEKRFLVYPPLMQALGSAPLGRRLDALRPEVHVFGHSHFGWDATLDDGIRYVQAALATPVERQRRPRSLMVSYDLDLDLKAKISDQPRTDLHKESLPLKIYDGATGGFCPPRRAAWSDHYAAYDREPHNTSPAPWVVDYYAKVAPRRLNLTEAEEGERLARAETRERLAAEEAKGGEAARAYDRASKPERVGMFDVARSVRQPGGGPGPITRADYPTGG